jgi:hypothetical protein
MGAGRGCRGIDATLPSRRKTLIACHGHTDMDLCKQSRGWVGVTFQWSRFSATLRVSGLAPAPSSARTIPSLALKAAQ